jgi:hypothetical protein
VSSKLNIYLISLPKFKFSANQCDSKLKRIVWILKHMGSDSYAEPVPEWAFSTDLMM